MTALPHGDVVHAPLAHWAHCRADARALCDGQRSLSFAELYAAVAQRAQALALAGAAAQILVDDAHPPLEQLLDFLGIVASGRCAALGDPDWPPAMRAAAKVCVGTEPFTAGAPHADTDFYIGFTSGSSAQPKGFRRSHGSWTASFGACLQAFGAPAALPLLIPGRISHSLFLFGALLGLWTGAGVELQDHFSPNAVFDRVRGGGACSLVAVPSQLIMLLQRAAQRALPPLPALQLILISGARWPRQHSAALQALFPQARICEFYGASELSFVAWTVADPAMPAALVGQPFAGVDIAIRPLAGSTEATQAAAQAQAALTPDLPMAGASTAASQTPGLVWVRSPMLFGSYVGDASADTSACLRDGDWVSVRDVGFLDPQGRLHMLGRLSRMIVTQAKKLFPEELEAVLESHPQVARASVHGVPDAQRGAAVVALIHWVPSAPDAVVPDAHQLAAWCRAQLQVYKVPRRFYVCTDWLWTGSGKTDHAALARALAQWEAANEQKIGNGNGNGNGEECDKEHEQDRPWLQRLS